MEKDAEEAMSLKDVWYGGGEAGAHEGEFCDGVKLGERGGREKRGKSANRQTGN